MTEKRTHRTEEQPSREQILEYAEFARQELLEKYGVGNLSNIEAVRLNHIVEECIKQQSREEKLVIKGELSPATVFNVDGEAAWRWLNELYGIRDRDVPRKYTIYVYEKEKGKDNVVFTSENREQADAAFNKLRAGRSYGEVWMNSAVTEDFKEYLRRLRESSHLL